MAKRNRKKRKAQSRRGNPSPESARAESITVFWTTSVLATVLALTGGLAARLALVFMDEPYPPVEMLSGLLLLISCVTGLVSMGLLPLVYRWRSGPPPRPVVRFAIVAAVLPYVILIAVAVFEW